MRRYSEFKNIWLGRLCRDGQCVSLFRENTEGFHDTPMLERLGATGGALGLYTRFNTDVGPVSRRILERIEFIQGSSDRPEEGDFVIFGEMPGNKYGHVGIMDSISGNNINILDQNGIDAMKGIPVVVKITTWRMDYVLGWLRFK